ncbi:MAG: hypothetical protein PHO02_03990 [Candidatus Nanoarchaeia archaeon]|nr:hypothetical protein [Candidatus Nanoarchaeia archaeon]
MQSETLEKLKSLSQSLKPLLKKYETIEDIIFFGSFVKGKSKPKDIDVALLVCTKDENSISKLEKEIEAGLLGMKADFTVFTLKEIYSEVWLSVITSGFSVSRGAFLREAYGIAPCKLYKYALTSLSPVQRVQFSRGLKAVSDETKSVRLSRAIVIVPLENSERFEEFLKTWDIDFETRRYELLPEYRKQAGLH